MSDDVSEAPLESAAVFEAFVRDRGPMLRAVAARIAARSSHDAEDLVQEALARAYEKRAVFASEDHLANWVLHVVRGLVVDERRSWYGRNVVAGADTEDSVALGADPADLVVAREDQRAMVRSVARLPHAQRELLWRHAVDGMSYAEIARVEGTPLATVRSVAHRARHAALRELVRATRSVGAMLPLVRVRHRLSRLPVCPGVGDAAGAAIVVLSLLLAGPLAVPGPPASVTLPESVRAAQATSSSSPRPEQGAATRPGQAEALPRGGPAASPSGPATERVPYDAQFTGSYTGDCTFERHTDSLIAAAFDYECAFSTPPLSCVQTNPDRPGCEMQLLPGGTATGTAVPIGAPDDAVAYNCQVTNAPNRTPRPKHGVLRYRPGDGRTYDIPMSMSMNHNVVTMLDAHADPRLDVQIQFTFPCAEHVDGSGLQGRVDVK